MTSRKDQIIGFFAWLSLCATSLFSCAYAASMGISVWYPALIKPVWTPSVMLMATVWTILFLFLAIAVWLVWLKQSSVNKGVLTTFVFQLVLLTIWAFVFFAAKNPAAAAIEIVIIWLVVLCLLALFFQKSVLAGWLVLPFFLWITFTAVLNIAIWRLNLG